MMPTDLVLKVGSIQRYNNYIVIAKEGISIGHNEKLNTEVQPVSMIVSTPVANIATNKTRHNEQFQVNNFYLGIGVTAVAFFISYIFLSK